jgi:hypothetical protein
MEEAAALLAAECKRADRAEAKLAELQAKIGDRFEPAVLRSEMSATSEASA